MIPSISKYIEFTIPVNHFLLKMALLKINILKKKRDYCIIMHRIGEDMKNNREVIRHCPHFYTIINFEYYGNDFISEKLIEVYEKYIFSCDMSVEENVFKVEKLDTILYKYISDYGFREQVKIDIANVRVKKGENVLEAVVIAIINFFDNYEKYKSRKVQVTRWI